MKKRWLAVGYLSAAHRARTPKLTEEQIIGILKENEAGKKVRELVRRYGVCEQTIYHWKSKYGGMDLSEARRLKALDKERRLLCVIHQNAPGCDTYSPAQGPRKPLYARESSGAVPIIFLGWELLRHDPRGPFRGR